MYEKNIKRILDIIFTILFLPFFSLLYALVGILIKIEDQGPVLYVSDRLGKNKTIFKMYKFRTMRVNSPDIRLEDGSTYNSSNDSRVTKIGKRLRESSLDEIPQILNILKGEMSVIGPRPDVESSKNYPEEYESFFRIKPGLTGYNQAYFRNEINRLEKMKNDKFYSDNISLKVDLFIVLKTFSVVLRRKGLYKD